MNSNVYVVKGEYGLMWPSRALSTQRRSPYESSFEEWCISLGFRFIRTQAAIDLLSGRRPKKPKLENLKRFWEHAQYYKRPLPPSKWNREILSSFGSILMPMDDDVSAKVLWERTREELKNLFVPWGEFEKEVSRQATQYETEWLEAKKQWGVLPTSCQSALKELSLVAAKPLRLRKPDFNRLQTQSFPDYLVFFKKCNSALVEIKSGRGSLKPHQKKFYPVLERMGHRVLVGRPSEAIDGWLFRDLAGRLIQFDFVPPTEFTLQ